MSDYLSPEDIESKLSLVVRKPQEGKTFICITNIKSDINSGKNNIHIVMTMNTISSSQQFFSRMENEIGTEKIVVFNSKKESAGDCKHTKDICSLCNIIKNDPEIKVIVCCAHEKRIRKNIIELFQNTSDSILFQNSRRNFTIHIDEAHKYIPENKKYICEYNDYDIVNSIIGYSATPDGIWNTERNTLFHKILIRDVEEEFQIIRSKNYFGVNNCKFHIFKPEEEYEDYIETKISEDVYNLSDMTEINNPLWYKDKWSFDLGNELELLRYIHKIIKKIGIVDDKFSYHFIPGYIRKATHYEIVNILLNQFNNANVISINGNGYELHRFNKENKKTQIVKKGSDIIEDYKNILNQRRLTEEEKKSINKKIKDLGEPSNMIQELIKDTPNCPTFITGFQCVGMSVTFINEALGNFDSVVMAHQHYNRDKLYQLCRFLFNYNNWSENNIRKIKETRFYSLTKEVIDICIEYEKSVEQMITEFSGKTCSLREIKGLEPEEPTMKEMKKLELESIKIIKSDWKKYKVYDGNDNEEWNKVYKFYYDFMGKEIKYESKQHPKIFNYFYHCSTTGNVQLYTIQKIENLKKQKWSSLFQLTRTSLKYARIFVGYENSNDPSEYSIYIKYVELENNQETKRILEKYYRKKNISSEI